MTPVRPRQSDCKAADVVHFYFLPEQASILWKVFYPRFINDRCISVVNV
jgi:hypothetical protein